jgi:hypothetical protein
MYAVPQILEPDFPRSWQEAVALVQEIIATLGPVTTVVPGPEDLSLDEDGTVSIGFARESAADPVTGLANLLMQLLDGTTAPPPLLSLAADNAKAPPGHMTIAAFSRALSFYERSDRRADVRAVVQRLASRRATASAEYAGAEDEVARLRERLMSQDEKPKENTLPSRKLPKPLSRHLAMAATIVISLLGGFAGAQLVGGPSAGPSPVARAASVPPAAAESVPSAPADAPAAVEEGTHAVEEGTHAVKEGTAAVKEGTHAVEERPQEARFVEKAAVKKGTIDTVTTPAHPPAANPGLTKPSAVRLQQEHAPAPRDTSADSRPPVRKSPAPASASNGANSIPLAPLPSSSRPASPTATKGINAGPAATDAKPEPISPRVEESNPHRIYSASEPNVVPARLTRSQLPKEPAGGADTGYFDIVVDEAGDVEFVKLISPKRRYEERMLVAAAKAWKFKPALLNGQPVKYRLRMPIIVADRADPR